MFPNKAHETLLVYPCGWQGLVQVAGPSIPPGTTAIVGHGGRADHLDASTSKFFEPDARRLSLPPQDG